MFLLLFGGNVFISWKSLFPTFCGLEKISWMLSVICCLLYIRIFQNQQRVFPLRAVYSLDPPFLPLASLLSLHQWASKKYFLLVRSLPLPHKQCLPKAALSTLHRSALTLQWLDLLPARSRPVLRTLPRMGDSFILFCHTSHWTVWGSQLMTVLRKPPTSTHLGLCKHRLQRGGFYDPCFCLFQSFQTHDITFLSLTRVFADLYTVHKTVLGATGIRSGPATSEWVKLLSCVYRLVTPWTIDYQAPPSMEFSRQEYWSGLLFPSPGDLPDPTIEPWSPTLQVDSTLWATREVLSWLLWWHVNLPISYFLPLVPIQDLVYFTNTQCTVSLFLSLFFFKIEKILGVYSPRWVLGILGKLSRQKAGWMSYKWYVSMLRDIDSYLLRLIPSCTQRKMWKQLWESPSRPTCHTNSHGSLCIL